MIPRATTYTEQPTIFSDWELLTLSGGKALERVMNWLARHYSGIKLGSHIAQGPLSDLFQAIDFYRSLNSEQAMERLYPKPSFAPAVGISKPYPLSQGQVLDLTFCSHFEPAYQPFREEYAESRENHTAHIRWWRHPPGQSQGAVIALHGWSMGDQRVNAITLAPGFFFRLGLDVLLYELPYHGKRAPGGSRDIIFPSAHLARTNEGIAQAIHDLRALRLWFEQEHGDVPVGVVGMSLGGYIASLWASLDRLSFVIPIAPLVSMEALAWQVLQDHSTEINVARAMEILSQLSFDDLKSAYAVHAPLNYSPQTPLERRMILAGLGDSVIPHDHPHSLWEHWGKPRIHWMEGGHLAQISESNAFSQVHAFLLSLKLAHSQLLEIKGS